MAALSSAAARRRVGSRRDSERLRAELQESLRDVLEQPDGRTEQRVTCDRVMRACIQQMGEEGTSRDHLESLMSLGELAYRGYHATSQGQPQLYGERLLFHLLRSSAPRARLDGWLSLSDHLYRGLENYWEESLTGSPLLKDYEAVAKNGFGVLWKRAEKEETEGVGHSRCRALTLRLSSLRFLVLVDRITVSNSSPLARNFALACALFEKGSDSQGGKESEHLAGAFEERLLPLLAADSPHSHLLLCQLTGQCCISLCKSGHPSRALGTLSRAEELLPSHASPHFRAALRMCGMGAQLHVGGDPLVKAQALLRSLPLAQGQEQRRALRVGCQQLLISLEGNKEGESVLSAQQLLELGSFLQLYLAQLQEEAQQEEGLPERSILLKQCFQNLELFTSRSSDYLQESQEKDAVVAESLVELCCNAIQKMAEVERLLTDEGLSEYAGATALRVYNLSYGFYTKKLFSLAAEVAVSLGKEGPPSNRFCHLSLPPDRVPKFFRLLVDCCRRAGRLALALEMVSVWLGAVCGWGSEWLIDPIALWVSIKADAVKTGNEELQLRTLKDALESWQLEPQTLADLLSEELRAYKRLRMDTAQERFNVICDLMRLADEDPGRGLEHMRAVQLVELAQVLCYRDFSQHTECSATDCAEEALGVLVSLPVTSENRQQLQDDQARASLWLYVCELEAQIQMNVELCRRKRAAAASTPDLEEGETNELDYEDRQQGASFPHDCINFNLRTETQRCKHLDKALSLWKNVLLESLAPTLRSPEQTVHDLHLMAALYWLIYKPFQVIESYMLSLNLLDRSSEPLMVLSVLLQMAEVLLLIEFVEPAGACLDEAELILKSSNPSKNDYLLLKTTYSVLRSQQMFTSQQIADGLLLLLEVLQSPSLQKPSKVWYLLKAKAQQLAALYLSLPASILPAQLRGQLKEQGWSSAESALTDSHKILCGIVMLLCPSVLMFSNNSPDLACPPNSGDNLFQKWLVLSTLLNCSRTLIRLLTTIGSAQEAKMFCRETLRLTAKLQCVRPFADLLVASAELELQRGNVGACSLELEQLMVLLESDAEFNAITTTTGGDGVRIRPRKGRAAQFRGESRESPAEEAPTFLHIRPFSCNDPAPSSLLSAQASSPLLKPKPLRCPGPMAHLSDCTCPVCSDLPLSSTSLRWALVQALLEASSGRPRESRSLLEAVQQRASLQASRHQVACWGLADQLKVVGLRSRENASQPAGPTDGIAAQACSQLAWLILNCDSLDQASKQLEASLQWLDLRKAGLLDMEQTRASLLLCKAVFCLTRLSQQHQCRLARIFSPVWGWSSNSAVWGKAKVSRKSKEKAGPDRTLSRAGPGRTLSRAGPGRTLSRAGPGRTLSRAGPQLRVLEDEPSTSTWVQPQAPTLVRARSRLQKHFDDSEAEEGGSPGMLDTGRQLSAATCKRQVKSTRPRQAASRGKKAAGQKRAPRRALTREVLESEVLRRCESAPQQASDCLKLERRRRLPTGDPPHPPNNEASSSDVTTLDSVYSCLSEAVACVSHCPPSGLYARACRLLALCMGSRHPHITAFLISESLAITSRHQMVQNLHRKILKYRKAQGEELMTRLQELSLCEGKEPDSQPHYLTDLRSVFEFSGAEPSAWVQAGADVFKDQLQQIPEDVVVCLLTLAPICSQDMGEVLLLTRLEKGRVPVMVQIPAESELVSVSSLLAEFDSILKEQKDVSNVTELKAWWEGRTALDQRMKHLVDSLETGVLGCWRGLLLPSCRDPQLEHEVAMLCQFLEESGYQRVEEELLKAVLAGSHLLTRVDIYSLAEGLCGSCPTKVGQYLEGVVNRLMALTGQPSQPSSQLILLLDKDLQRLPWESVPTLRGRRVSRLPNFQFLLGYTFTRKHQLKSVLTEGVNPANVFYVLNPQGNLPNTEKIFKAWFQRKEGWDGVVGRGPSPKQLRSVLCNSDLYMYAGHGAGVRFLEGQEIQKLTCRAASLLVGCSSATLALRGNLEGVGIVLKYMMAGCPLFLGNLWDVTDKDIDRYMEHLLRGWLDSQDQASLLDHLSQARQAPKLKYLIGASPVAYGLNISLQSQDTLARTPLFK